jgi:D-alanyl-D-alanine carboxypeptidase/D-alanyl-D-alanine-endopeptidase (penicillin-binding protein 4)
LKYRNDLLKRLLQLVLKLFVFLLIIPAHSQNPTITQSLNTFLKSKGLEHASVSFCLREADSNHVVCSYNADQSLIPASTMKVVTTGAALGILGADYRFKTSIGYTGEIQNGILKGNVIITGGGDPSLGSDRVINDHNETWFADRISAILAAKGVKQINGGIIISGSHFQDDRPITWPYNDIGNYYASPAFGFNFDENQYKLLLKPGKYVGDPVQVKGTQPYLPLLTFNDHLTTAEAGSQDSGYICGAPESNCLDLYGAVPGGRENFTIKGAIPHPEVIAKQSILKRLQQTGISIRDTNTIASTLNETLQKLDDIYSPPLSDIIHYTNLKSLNLYAECLLKEMAVHSGKTGNTPNGTATVLDYWKNNGINTNGLFMYDGSGLSHFDAISAAQLCDILSYIRKQTYFEVFNNSLPVAGQSGAMSLVGKGTAIEGRLHAKTGHMDRVRSYAGYFKAKNGKWYSFALIVNNYTCSGSEIRNQVSRLLSSFATLDKQ